METRTFVFAEGSSHKFWTIAVEGSSHTVHFGRVGTKGQVKTKEFADDAAAFIAAERLIAEKVGKGYVAEGTATPPPAPAPPAPRPAERTTPEPPSDPI